MWLKALVSASGEEQDAEAETAKAAKSAKTEMTNDQGLMTNEGMNYRWTRGEAKSQKPKRRMRRRDGMESAIRWHNHR